MSIILMVIKMEKGYCKYTHQLCHGVRYFGKKQIRCEDCDGIAW